MATLLNKVDYLFLVGLLCVSLLAIGIWFYFDTWDGSVKVDVESVSVRLDSVTDKVGELERIFDRKFRQLDARLTKIEQRLQDGG